MGGHVFTTRLATLVADQDSMLSAMFSGRFEPEVDSEGRYFIDRDGKYFEHILNFLRDATIIPPPTVALKVYQEAKYYRIERLMAHLECYPEVMAITKLKDQKTKMGNNYEHWKQMLLDAVCQKYNDVIRFSIGQECMITAVRYISKQDYISATSPCGTCRKQSLESAESPEKDSRPKHNFYCSDDTGMHLSYYIGCDLPAMDLVIPEDEINDICLFTSLLEKDLRSDGFCVSGRSSHSWRCSHCDAMGYLHQIAFTWNFT